jgi:hypothetical protein
MEAAALKSQQMHAGAILDKAELLWLKLLGNYFVRYGDFEPFNRNLSVVASLASGLRGRMICAVHPHR